LQDKLASDAWKIIAALNKEKGDLEVPQLIFKNSSFSRKIVVAYI